VPVDCAEAPPTNGCWCRWYCVVGFVTPAVRLHCDRDIVQTLPASSDGRRSQAAIEHSETGKVFVSDFASSKGAQ
jgi:hypothetical protein